MSEKLTVDMEVRKSDGVAWFLNTIGAHLNSVLPAWILARLWGRWLGWIPLLRYRLEPENEWTLLTVRDALERGLVHPTEGDTGESDG